MPITSYRFFHRDNWTDPEGVFCKLQPLSKKAIIDFIWILDSIVEKFDIHIEKIKGQVH